MFSFFSGVVALGVVCTGVSANLYKWMGDGPCPWGERTVQDSHSYDDIPDTVLQQAQEVILTPEGKTRYYELTITRATFAPDGVSMSLIVANGQFPGPLIEANWGDWIQVNVKNKIYSPEEALSIHYHGVNQLQTPFFDGVPAVTQCPIIPGHNLTYRFRADEYGTSWWHSHLSAQYTQGLFGPLVIHGPNHVAYDEDLGVITVNDWYHDYYADIVANATGPAPPGGFRPSANSNLVHGTGRFPCANITDGKACTITPYASWHVEPGKTYRARFVNTGSSSFEIISIDNHTMTIIANDFVPVQPYEAKFVTLGVGQRTDVVFTATGLPGESFWVRALNSPGCADTKPDAAEGKGVILYTGADPSIEPTSLGLARPANPLCGNDALSLTVPVYPIPAVTEPDLIITIDIRVTQTIDPATGKGPLLFTLNNSSYVGDESDPLLLSVITQDTTTFPKARNVYNTGSSNTVRLIFINNFLAPHPMHIHGHDFQVLAEGHGLWDGTITNPENPQRRDVQMIWFGANSTNPAIGPDHLVLQYMANNAGMWLVHCHIAWHLAAGMLMTMLEKPNELMGLNSQLPQSVRDTCTSYTPWAAANGIGNTP